MRQAFFSSAQTTLDTAGSCQPTASLIQQLSLAINLVVKPYGVDYISVLYYILPFSEDLGEVSNSPVAVALPSTTSRCNLKSRDRTNYRKNGHARPTTPFSDLRPL